MAEGVPQKASFAVLSHALWNAAFTEPYQKMILHTLYPLYEFATDQRELPDAMQVASKRLRALRFKHTYIKRRFATTACCPNETRASRAKKTDLVHFFFPIDKRGCTFVPSINQETNNEKHLYGKRSCAFVNKKTKSMFVACYADPSENF
ncbi:MAG: hypothetical protein V6Z78_04925 [Holosporaceae bacterium]